MNIENVVKLRDWVEEAGSDGFNMNFVSLEDARRWNSNGVCFYGRWVIETIPSYLQESYYDYSGLRYSEFAEFMGIDRDVAITIVKYIWNLDIPLSIIDDLEEVTFEEGIDILNYLIVNPYVL